MEIGDGYIYIFGGSLI